MSFDQRFGLRDVGLLAPRQDELDRIAQAIDGDVDLGAESAYRSPQRLIVVYPFFSTARQTAKRQGNQGFGRSPVLMPFSETIDTE